jgi:hypothetical protein
MVMLLADWPCTCTLGAGLEDMLTRTRECRDSAQPVHRAAAECAPLVGAEAGPHTSITKHYYSGNPRSAGDGLACLFYSLN